MGWGWVEHCIAASSKQATSSKQREMDGVRRVTLYLFRLDMLQSIFFDLKSLKQVQSPNLLCTIMGALVWQKAHGSVFEHQEKWCSVVFR